MCYPHIDSIGLFREDHGNQEVGSTQDQTVLKRTEMRPYKQNNGTKRFLSSGIVRLAGSCDYCTTTRQWGWGAVAMRHMIQRQEIERS